MYIDGIIYLAYFILLLSTGYAIWLYKNLPLAFRVLTGYLCWSALIQGLSEAFAYFHVNNLAFSHLHVMVGMVLLTWFYSILLTPFISKKLFFGVGFSFVVLAILNALLWQPIFSFNTNTLTAESVLVVIFSLSTFILLLNDALNQHIRHIQTSLNWINSGLFVYYSGSLLLFYNGEIIMHVISQKWSEYTWMAHVLMSIILHLTILIGIWKSPRKLTL